MGRDFMEALYLNYKRLMLSTAGRYFPGQEDQEDVVQDAVLRLLRHAGKLEAMEVDRLPGYIVFTVRSVAIDLLRKKNRAPESVLDDGQPDPGAPLVLDRIIFQEALEKLRTVWPSLSPEEQLLLEGKYIWNCTDGELAEALGCQTSSVRMKLTRARRRALEAMNHEEGGQTK